MEGKRCPFKHFSVFVMLAMSLCCSCNKDVVYNQYQPIQHKVWEQSSEFFFVFDIQDIAIPYNLFLHVRNNDTYPYQNIWMLFELKNDSIARKDTVEYYLADDLGKWKGSGLTLFQNQFVLHEKYHFPDTGQYTLNIRHGMRDERLKGIEDIGLWIEKAK